MNRGLLIAASFLLFNLKVFGQEMSEDKIKRTYIQLGRSNSLFAVKPATVNLSLIRETKNNLLIGLRFYNSFFKDKEYPTPNRIDCFGCPTHYFNEWNFSIGKVKNINRHFAFSVSTGPTYINYNKPENIKPSTDPGGISHYEYVQTIHHMPGWSLRLDTNYFPLRYVGLGAGLFFNYNEVNAINGFNVNILLGKLKNKSITSFN